MGSAFRVGRSTLSRCLGPVLTVGSNWKADVSRGCRGRYLVYCGNNKEECGLFWLICHETCGIIWCMGTTQKRHSGAVNKSPP